VHTKMVGTPDGSTPPFYRMAELYFPSLEALKSCATSESAQKVVAHAVSISTGGMPIVLIAEEETINF
jgi:uncharacterized protein (TIGR02118 family)